MDSITINALRKLLELIETAECAKNREIAGTDAHRWYQHQVDSHKKTFKRMTDNACNSQVTPV